MPLSRVLALSGVALVAAAVPSHAQATNADVQNVVVEVCGGVGARLREQNDRGANTNMKPDCVAVKTDGSLGAWRLGIPAVCKGEAGYLAVGNRIPMMSFLNPAIIENLGNAIRWIFVTQPFTEQERPFVDKQLADNKREFANEFKDVKVDVQPANGGYAFVAVIPVNGRFDRGDVLKRLDYFARKGYFLACDVYTGHELARMDNWNRLKGTKLTRLTNDEVVLLNPILQEGNYAVKGVPGYWHMLWDDYGVAIINADTTVRLGVSIKYGTVTSKEKALRTDTLLKEWVQKNRFKNATTWINWDTDAGRLWILAELPYSTMTGREFMDTVKEFYNDYAKDKQKPFRRIVNDNIR